MTTKTILSNIEKQLSKSSETLPERLAFLEQELKNLKESPPVDHLGKPIHNQKIDELQKGVDYLKKEIEQAEYKQIITDDAKIERLKRLKSKDVCDYFKGQFVELFKWAKPHERYKMSLTLHKSEYIESFCQEAIDVFDLDYIPNKEYISTLKEVEAIYKSDIEASRPKSTKQRQSNGLLSWVVLDHILKGIKKV